MTYIKTQVWYRSYIVLIEIPTCYIMCECVDYISLMVVMVYLCVYVFVVTPSLYCSHGILNECVCMLLLPP